VTGACSAAYQVVNQWQGGFQANVTVTAGNSAINGWTVRWAFPGSQAITQLWSGTPSTSGQNITVRNASYNAAIPANATTTFGFTATGAGSPAPATPTCTSP
jgi:cellulase/cellobiase CelA1